MTPHPTRTTGRPALWLLDLDLGGRVLRVATRAVAVQSDGDELSYRAGLTLGDVELSADSVGASIQGVDWARLVAQGVALDRRPFLLRRWWEGMELEEALVVLTGRTTDPEWGSPDQPDTLTISLAEDVGDQSVIWPPQSATVDATTWHDASYPPDPGINGAVYPWVIGYPGRDVIGIVGAVASGSPALLVKSGLLPSIMIIAGHRVEAGKVTIFDATGRGSRTFDVVHTADLLGREVAAVEIDVADPDFQPEPGRQFYAGWTNEKAGHGGGFPGRNGEPLRGLGDWLLYACRRMSSAPHDWGRMEANADQLNRLKLDFCWNSRITWDDWVTRNVLQDLPVVRLRSQHGIYYAHVDWQAGHADTVAWLDADGSGGIPVRRVSSVRQTDEELSNEITVEFAMHAPNGVMLNRVTLSAEPGYMASSDPGMLPDSRVLPDQRCRVSQSTYGVRPSARQLRITWDRATAVQVARYWAARSALPHLLVEYVGPPDLLRFERYTWVRLQDTQPGACFEDRLALVLDHTLVGDGRQVVTSLLVRTDPQDPRSVA